MARAADLDGAFLSIAQQMRGGGGVDALLSSFFSFLHRRTDFYVVQPPEGAPMGFAPGVAQKMVQRAFEAAGPMKTYASVAGVPQQRVGKAPPSLPRPAATPKKVELPLTANAAQPNAAAVPAASTAAAPPAPLAVPAGLQMPIANGGVAERYYWRQTLADLTVYFPVPTATRGRDVTVDVRVSSLRVLVQGEVLLDGSLHETVRPSDVLWSVEDDDGVAESGRVVSLTLEKRAECWWPCVLVGDPHIDTTKVDSTRYVDEYDEETQGAIRKIMYDQRRKAQGLPTSEDEEVDSILAKARNLPGSPFAQDAGGGG